MQSHSAMPMKSASLIIISLQGLTESGCQTIGPYVSCKLFISGIADRATIQFGIG